MKRAMVAVLALGALGAQLAGCEADPFGRSAADVRAEQKACAEAGGTWAPGGITGALTCFTEAPDAGQPCSRETDCAGLCIADDGGSGGSCSRVSPLFGCWPILDAGGNRSELCID